MKLAAFLLACVAALTFGHAQTNPPLAVLSDGSAVATNTPDLKLLLKGKTFTNATGMVMVRVGANYWVSKHLVSQGEYQKVIGSNPSRFAGQNHPVDSVSWNDAIGFCSRVTEAERKKGYLPEGCEYTLPTQAQWEAMAAGTPLTQAVTSEKSARNSTAAVGSLPTNNLGLHDVRGNLWEWCLDPQDQPYRVLRGGAWNTSLEVNLRPEFRWYSNGPGERKEIFGFRCVLQEVH